MAMIHKIDGLRIRTEIIDAPIPDRRFDWCAVDDETYDGAPDNKHGQEMGFGATEQQAIEDLLQLIQDRS